MHVYIWNLDLCQRMETHRLTPSHPLGPDFPPCPSPAPAPAPGVLLQRRGGPMEAPTVGGDDSLLRPLQGLAQDRGRAGEDEDARAQERKSGHALLGVVRLGRAHPGVRARLLPPLLMEPRKREDSKGLPFFCAFFLVL